jgi:hypothetical protein
MSTSQSLEDRARDVAAAAREALATPAAPVTPVEKCGMCGGTCDPRPSWVCRSCGEAHWKTAPVTPVELTHEESTDGGKTWRSVATPASGDIPLRYGVLVRKAAPAPVTPKESTTKEYRKGLRAGLDKAWGIVNRERVEGGEQEAFRVRARDAIFAELEANAPAVTPKGEPRAAFDEGVRWAATYVRQRGLRFKQHVNDPYTANALLTLADELADHGKTPPSEPQGEAPPAPEPERCRQCDGVLILSCPEGCEPPEKCESGCAEPVTHHDVEGVPLCTACFDSLPDEQPPEDVPPAPCPYHDEPEPLCSMCPAAPPAPVVMCRSCVPTARWSEGKQESDEKKCVKCGWWTLWRFPPEAAPPAPAADVPRGPWPPKRGDVWFYARGDRGLAGQWKFTGENDGAPDCWRAANIGSGISDGWFDWQFRDGTLEFVRSASAAPTEEPGREDRCPCGARRLRHMVVTGPGGVEICAECKRPCGDSSPGSEAFEVWWTATGRFIDPDDDSVPRSEKREGLAHVAFVAGLADRDAAVSRARAEQLAMALRRVDQSKPLRPLEHDTEYGKGWRHCYEQIRAQVASLSSTTETQTGGGR